MDIESCDSETKYMKNQLTEYGLNEEDMTKDEMSDLLKAINNSKTSFEEESSRQVVEQDENDSPPQPSMKRRYLNVRDRRMPWSLLPVTISQKEKACALAIYIKMMSVNNYRQARQLTNLATWPPPIQIVEGSTRVQPLRSTRSGRSVPVYSGYDDDSSDMDFVITKTKRRKVSNSDHVDLDGLYTNKVISLKRKSQKDENTRPVKEVKTNTENNLAGNNTKTKRDIFSPVER